MPKLLVTTLALCCLALPGCAPLLLAGGAIAMIDQAVQRKQAVQRVAAQERAELARRQGEQEKARLVAQNERRLKEQHRREQAQDAYQRQLAAAQRAREAEESSRQRRAALEAHRREKQRREQLASEAERERQIAEQQRREVERVRIRTVDTKLAQAKLRATEEALTSGRWSSEGLSRLMKAVDAASQTEASRDVLGRLRVGAGLMAYLIDNREAAAKQWRIAHELGMNKPRSVASAVWTPGALEAFSHAY